MANCHSCCIYVNNQVKFIETRPNHSKTNLATKYLYTSEHNCRERKTIMFQ